MECRYGKLLSHNLVCFVVAPWYVTYELQFSTLNHIKRHINPYIFMIFLEPLLRWLEHDKLGHHSFTSEFICNTNVYTVDIDVVTNNLNHMQLQIDKP